MQKVIEIYSNNPRKGHTAWILKSALKNPRVIIVGANAKQSKILEKEYFRLKNKRNFIEKIFSKKGNPLFLSLENNIVGYKMPIIFDNSCFTNQ